MEDKHRRLEPIPFDRVKVLGGLWKERIDTVRNVTTRACAAKVRGDRAGGQLPQGVRPHEGRVPRHLL